MKDINGHDIYEGDLVNINVCSKPEVTPDGCDYILKDIIGSPVCILSDYIGLAVVGHIYQ